MALDHLLVLNSMKRYFEASAGEPEERLRQAFTSCLVLLGVVKLVETVLCKQDELLGCSIIGHQRCISISFFFTLRCCLSHRLVKISNAITQCINLIRQLCWHLSTICEGRLMI